MFGAVGTPQRDKYDEDLEISLIGEAIKRTRQEKNLIQEDLAKLLGVRHAQIAQIEDGKNLTFATAIRLFKVMGVSAKLEIGSWDWLITKNYSKSGNNVFSITSCCLKFVSISKLNAKASTTDWRFSIFPPL